MPPKLLVNSPVTQTPFLSVNGGTSAPANPSFFQRVGDFLSGNPIVKGVTDALLAPPAPKSFNPVEIANAGWDSLTSGVKQSANAISNFENTLGDVFGTAIARATATPQAKPYITSSVSPLDVGVSTANAGLGIANAAFAPLTSAIQAVAHIPGVGYAADALNNIMGAVGQAGAIPTGLAVDSAYQKGIISADTRDKIKPPLQNFAALLAQIAAGKVGADAIGDIKAKATEAVDSMNMAIEAARKAYEMGPVKPLMVNGESTTNPISFANDYRAPESTIQMGVKPKETLPVVATSPADTFTIKAPVGYSYEPIKPTEAPVAPESARTAPITPKTENIPPVESAPAPEIQPTRAPTPELRVVPLNEPASKEVIPQKTGQVTKAANDINQTLVRQGYDALSPELQSKYTPESYKAELVKAKELTTSNYEDAIARATGKTPVGNYEGQILFNEVERIAMGDGDYQTLLDLAKSPLGKKLSEAGQALGAAGFNDNPSSPVRAIQEIQKARESAVEKVKVEATTRLEDAVKKTNTKQSWSEFVKSIQC